MTIVDYKQDFTNILDYYTTMYGNQVALIAWGIEENVGSPGRCDYELERKALRDHEFNAIRNCFYGDASDEAKTKYMTNILSKNDVIDGCRQLVSQMTDQQLEYTVKKLGKTAEYSCYVSEQQNVPLRLAKSTSPTVIREVLDFALNACSDRLDIEIDTLNGNPPLTVANILEKMQSNDAVLTNGEEQAAQGMRDFANRIFNPHIAFSNEVLNRTRPLPSRYPKAVAAMQEAHPPILEPIAS